MGQSGGWRARIVVALEALATVGGPAAAAPAAASAEGALEVTRTWLRTSG